MQDVRQIARSLQFPVGLLGSAYAGGYGRVWHLPVNFTIDRQGLLADNGWTDDSPVWTAERLERVVLPLLQKKLSSSSSALSHRKPAADPVRRHILPDRLYIARLHTRRSKGMSKPLKTQKAKSAGFIISKSPPHEKKWITRAGCC